MSAEQNYLDGAKINDVTDELTEDVYDVTDTFSQKEFEGDRISLDDILDQTIIITDFILKPSEFSDGDFAIIQVVFNDKKGILMSGSQILLSGLKKYKDKLPIRCKIIKRQSPKTKRRYYALSAP